jgi:hypothetical protein
MGPLTIGVKALGIAPFGYISILTISFKFSLSSSNTDQVMAFYSDNILPHFQFHFTLKQLSEGIFKET